MKVRGNTVLITGGATGIGFALAEAFVREGNEVIICGRREEKLREAKGKLPSIHTKRCDLSEEKERQELHEWIISNFKNVNVLVNNAGIQRMIDLRKGNEAMRGEDEVEVNFKACVHLSALFIPDFLKQKEAAIINVSSGLAFIPLAAVPVYCATKAAIHSFTLSLRHQLKDTGIKVFEIIPPIVDTELDRGAREERGQEDRGIKPEEVAISALKSIKQDQFEIAIGMAEGMREGARKNPEEVFKRVNG